MKFLGEETKVEVKTKSVRQVEYLRCDKCGKKILPVKRRDEEGSYIHIMTCHHDWGNDSCESVDHKEMCKKCAKEYVAEYIEESCGTEELELEHCYLFDEEMEDYEPYDEGYVLVVDDYYEGDGE